MMIAAWLIVALLLVAALVVAGLVVAVLLVVRAARPTPVPIAHRPPPHP